MDVSAADQVRDRLRAAHQGDGPLSIRQRRALLRGLQRAIGARKDALTSAASVDARGRSAREILRDELWPCHRAAAEARKHLKEWSLPEPVELPAVPFRPGRARVTYQPRGVVGIISARSAPIRTALSPLISAIAAGNRVILKPSEHTPQTAALLSTILSEVFGDAVAVVLQGGPAVGAALCRAGLDHLHVTGSAATGRAAMAAASASLTPISLAVGGKSPAVIHPSYPIATAARRIMAAKLVGAGQSCVAPDYVLCPADKVDAFVAACAESVTALYPTLAENPEYAAIVDDEHRWRLSSWVDEAVSAGATKHELNPAGEDLSGSPKLAPVVLTGVPEDTAVRSEEIFGPLLVVVPYADAPGAIWPPPPRLYCFDNNRRRAQAQAQAAGGVTINHGEVHGVHHLLPGGFVGFETFSRRVPVYAVGRPSLLPALRRPFLSRVVERLMRLLMR